MIDFDIAVERRNTSSAKWDRYRDRLDILPMWMADMDFKSPPPVTEALRRRVDHGVFGYTTPPDELLATVIAMFKRDYGWDVAPEWLLWFPGVVPGLHTACRALTTGTEMLMTATPIFFRFFEVAAFAGRHMVRVPMRQDGTGRYALDFEALERAITPAVKMFLLCNPHNPVGRVYTRDELERLAEICCRHNLIIVSDEVHCGLVLDEDKRHLPIASLAPEIARRTVTLMSPSKTYNTPGLGCAFTVIPDPMTRLKMQQVMRGMVPLLNALGYAASLAAYRDCAQWHRELMACLRRNRDLLEQTVSATPCLSMPHVEATYLGWIDVRALHLEQPVAHFERFGIGLSDGADFGQPGFVRINFACPLPQLKTALERLTAAATSAVG